jgi:hypothetical protein
MLDEASQIGLIQMNEKEFSRLTDAAVGKRTAKTSDE